MTCQLFSRGDARTDGHHCTLVVERFLRVTTKLIQDFAQEALGNFSYAIPFMIAILLIGTLNSNIFCGSRYSMPLTVHHTPLPDSCMRLPVADISQSC